MSSPVSRHIRHRCKSYETHNRRAGGDQNRHASPYASTLMLSIQDYAEQLWNGTLSTRQPEGHPFAALNQIDDIAADVAFYKAFVNLTVVKTEAGLVLIDTGSFHPVAQQRSFEKVRSWSAEPVHTAIYTHGHVDHAYGLPPFLREG